MGLFFASSSSSSSTARPPAPSKKPPHDAARTVEGDGAVRGDDAAAAADEKRLLAERLAQAQQSQVRESTVALRQAIDAYAGTHTPSERAADQLEQALEEARDVGIHPDLLAEGQRVLRDRELAQLEGALRLAIGKGTEGGLQAAITQAKKRAAAKKIGGAAAAAAAAVSPSLLVEAEEALKSLRRTNAARARLERDIEMAGPAALARAVEVARCDQYTPPKTLAKAERILRQRRREQCAQRWLDALRETARQRGHGARPLPHAGGQRDGPFRDPLRAFWEGAADGPVQLWACAECTFLNHFARPSCEMCGSRRPPNATTTAAPAGPHGGGPSGAGGGGAARLPSRQPRLEALGAEVRRKLREPLASPPAWLHFLQGVYAEFPPPALRPSQLARARASLVQAGHSRLARTVPRALMEAIRIYHPDKNAESGPEWRQLAEEITKMANELHGEYKARIERAHLLP